MEKREADKTWVIVKLGLWLIFIVVLNLILKQKYLKTDHFIVIMLFLKRLKVYLFIYPKKCFSNKN